MKLVYHTRTPNFGDQLNPFLFERLLPGFFDEDERIRFLGIGSIIGTFAPGPCTAKQLVFSSGFAYGAPPKDLGRHEFWCVRGPETARLLGLDPAVAIADGALLLRHLPFETLAKRHDYAFMPHEHAHVHHPAWRALAQRAGFHYIDPHAPVEQVIAEIRASRVLVSEAMHGAIVADVFRVPWIPLVLYASTNPIKWRDWTESLGVPYEPVRFPPLGSRQASTELLQQRMAGQPALQRWLAPACARVYDKTVMARRRGTALRLLARLRTAKTHLSDEAVLQDRADRLLVRLRELETAHRQPGTQSSAPG